jgi:signal transduction histidine kinase/CheY-like chemotaxis protein
MSPNIDTVIGEGLTRRTRIILLGILIVGVSLEISTRPLDQMLPIAAREFISLFGQTLMVTSVFLIALRSGAARLVIVCMGTSGACIVGAQVTRILSILPAGDGQSIIDNTTKSYDLLLDVFDGVAPAALILGFFLLAFQINRVWLRLATRAQELKQEVENRRQAERALQEIEAREKAQYKGLPVPTYTWQQDGDDFVLVDYNDAAALASKNLLMGHPGIKASEEYAERPDIVALLSDCATGKRSINAEISFWFEATKEQRELAVKFAFVPPTYVLVHAEDITGRRRAERALQRTEMINRSLLEGSPVCNKIIGVDGKLQYMSSAGITQLKIADIESLYGEVYPSTLYPESIREPLVLGLKQALAGTRSSVEAPIPDADGNHVWFDTTFVPALDEDGQIKHVIATSVNITQRRRSEEKRRQLEIQMQQTQKLESLGVMAGGIAHDFNNILHAIIGNADLALAALAPDSPGRDNLQEIGLATRRAAELTSQMLAYSGKGTMTNETLDLSELVQEMANLLEVSHSKKARVQYQFATAIPAVLGDPSQLRQIVMNLITNASEAIGEKGGAITVETGLTQATQAHLSNTYTNDELPGGAYVYLRVTDTGCGMDRETHRRIFEPFFTTKFTGRGLGMAAVLGIVRAHRGAIDIRSEVGHGTTVNVLLPAQKERATPTLETISQEEEWTASGLILVVDDEPSIRNITRDTLERRGFTVLTARDGREAVDIFQEHQDEIVCVLLDLTMPNMGGEEAFFELQKIRDGIPIVLVSGYSEEQLQERVEDLGFAGFLKKPVDSSRLYQQVRAAMNSSSHPHSQA